MSFCGEGLWILSKRELPPLRSLAAFEAVARLGSFRKAADELCISRWAVSHRVKLLEEKLGVQLLERHVRPTDLTKAGHAYFPTVSEALDLIEIQTRFIRSHHKANSSECARHSRSDELKYGLTQDCE